PAAARGEPVCAAGGHRASGPVRAAGDHQHGFDAAPDPDQGHDAAVSVLWRVVDARAGALHGDGAGADPAPAEPERAVSRAAPRFVLAAGGTGGHLFPAQALAEQLIAHGAMVHLAIDRRSDSYAAPLPGIEVCRIHTGRIGGGPLHSAYGAAVMAAGL